MAHLSPTKMPRRLGMIGLSANATTSWASRAHLPGLVTAEGKAHYTIVALCNSSVEAATAAVKKYQFDTAEVKVYGEPEGLAADPHVQVVSCNTRIDRHYETILPSVKAGKDVYVEWPIASSRAHVAELVAAARESGSRVAVGLQGRWAPPALKMKEILGKGQIGRILSSEMRAYGGLNDRASMPEGLKYFADKEVGGNPIMIGFGHAIDMVQSVIGDLDPATTHAHLQIQRPRRTVVKGPDRQEVGHVDSNVPDLISVHGSLHASPLTGAGATLTALFRTGQPYPGQPSLVWTVNGEKGEIRLVSPATLSLQTEENSEPVTIHVHDFATNTVEPVHWSWPPSQKEIPVAARCVQSCLYALAEGDPSGYVELEDAARRAEQIFSWLDQKPLISR